MFGSTTIALPGTTLLPGLVEGHSHLLLHPYNETPWDDQVLHESEALRVARAVNHARATLRVDGGPIGKRLRGGLYRLVDQLRRGKGDLGLHGAGIGIENLALARAFA